MERHFLAYDAPQFGGRARAICGRTVRVDSHSNEPTCTECIEIKAADDAQTIDSMFGDRAPGTPVHHTPFNPTAGYSERRR